MTDQERTDFIFRTVNTPHQFSYENGITVTHVEPGYAKGELVVGPNSINPHKNVHGGAMATLADTVGGCCACSRGGVCVTAGSTMEFLRPASGKKIFCVATPKKMGAETAEANLNAGLAAARQIVDFFRTGNTRFQVNK